MAQTSLNSTGVASSGALSLQSNGTTEAIGISTGQVATLAQNPILTSGTANGVAYLNGSKVVTSGSALVFDGTNFGVGVTPSAWGAGQRAIQSGNFTASGGGNGFTSNGYYNAGWKYVANGYATNIYEQSGAIKFDIAASGTAGNAITFTQAMTLDASGRLLVGTSVSPSSSSVRQVLSGTSGAQDAYLQLAYGGGGGGYVASATGAGIIFGSYTGAVGSETYSAERARIDSSGNLLVGKTSANTTSGTGVQLRPDGSVSVVAPSSLGDTFDYYNSTAGAFRFYVTNAGVINATSTTITGISDQRLKENIRDLDDGLETVMALKPRKFDWKEGKGAGTKNARGFIAQEFEQVFPDLIDEWKDPAPEGEEPYKAVRADLIPTLVKAIQELNAKFEAYKAAHP